MSILKIYFTLFLMAVLFIAINSCVKNANSQVSQPSKQAQENKPCINDKIQEIESKEVANPPIEIYEWKYESETYYYITAKCCDQFSELYDQNCNIVCRPDGGITGKGDGKCPYFIPEKLSKKLIWEDKR